MLVIHTSSKINKSWHVGQPSPMTGYNEIANVTSLFADGDEADFIKSKFNNSIPWNFKSPANQQCWFGDIAKTIVYSLI